MPKSIKHVPSLCYNFWVPEMEMAAIKPELSVFLTISREWIDIRKIPSATPMFSTMTKSSKHVRSLCYNFWDPEMEMAATKPELSVFLTISRERIDIRKIPSATPMFSTMPKSIKHVPSLFYNFWVPEMEMAAIKPEVSVFLMISREWIEIFEKFQVLHRCFQLCPSQ